MARHLSRRCAVIVALVVAAGLGAAAAVTTPFTPGAEATVAAGFLVVLAALPLRRVAGGSAGAGPDGSPVPGDATKPDAPVPRVGYRWGWRWALVVAPLLVTVAWELLCFAHGDRAAWPTLSSLLDDVDASPLGRGVACAAWLGLGWALVTR